MVQYYSPLTIVPQHIDLSNNRSLFGTRKAFWSQTSASVIRDDNCNIESGQRLSATGLILWVFTQPMSKRGQRAPAAATRGLPDWGQATLRAIAAATLPVLRCIRVQLLRLVRLCEERIRELEEDAAYEGHEETRQGLGEGPPHYGSREDARPREDWT